jgi:uncharacterized protein (TIGR03118 family)
MRKMPILLAFVGGAAGAAACGGESAPVTHAESAALKVVDVKHPFVKIAAVVKETDLVRDDAGDVLSNAWGLAFPTGGRFAWMSSNGTGNLQLYDANGIKSALTVAVPNEDPAEDHSLPTGLLFNPSSSAGLFKGDVFIGVSEGGTVFGWAPTFADPNTAMIRFPVPPVAPPPEHPIYKGAALVTFKNKGFLFVADFHDNKVVVFDDNYLPVKLHPGAFVDHHLPPMFAPFNIVFHDNLLFVSYAKQDDNAEDDVPAVGNGFIDIFTLDGHLVQRLISDGVLNSPWGMAFMAGDDDDHRFDSKFDRKEKVEHLLVGNFGDGFVHVYDLELEHGQFEVSFDGALGDAFNHKLFIDGLWSLSFGTGQNGCDEKALFFTAGPGGETGGVFGRLNFVTPVR